MARSTGSPFLSLTSDIKKAKFVAQQDLARHFVQVRFFAITLAAQFADGEFAAPGYRFGQSVTQIKIPADAFAALADKTEHRLGMIDVDLVLHFTVLVDSFRIEVRQVHGQSF